MVAAFELRATKYTVFFIVSVGRTLLLSALVKLVSKSPYSITCTVHSLNSWRSPWIGSLTRVMRDKRTRDFP